MNDTEATLNSPTDHAELTNAGYALRQAREASGLHIAALAVILKVPVKKLEALEGNRLDLLPDAVFARALAASVCRTLKVDAAPILARLPLTSTPKLTSRGTGINQKFQSPGDLRGPSMWAQLSLPAVISVSALLFGALVLMFFPAIKAGFHVIKAAVTDSSMTSLASIEAIKPADKAVQFKSTALVNEPMSVQGASGVGLAPSEGTQIVMPLYPSVTAAFSASQSDVKAALSGNGSAASPPVFAANNGTPSAADIVVLTFKGDSWVEVTDAKGQTVLRRMLGDGEVVGAAGPLPLRVVVGKANVTQVQIRGKAFDLNPVSKDNVARFEVK